MVCSFLASVMLRQGRFGWADFDRHLDDSVTLAFCKQVQMGGLSRSEEVMSP